MLHSRRRILQLGVASVGMVCFAGSPAATAAMPPMASEPPSIRANRFTDRGLSEQATTAVSQSRHYTSAVYRSPFPITAIGPFWTGTAAALTVRFSPDGQNWSDWHAVTLHESHLGPPDPAGRQFGDLIDAAGARYVQYRLTIPAGAVPPEVSLELIDSSTGPSIRTTPPQIQALSTSAIPIISRAQWGCDESLRFDSNGQLLWPLEYRTVQKVIVHHTATANFEDDPASTVRAIYYYHAVTRGWGDIGYNLLVDWRGNVYEGRFGGDKVVGGHAYSYSRSLSFNYGSLGIGNLGTFSTVSPSSAMRSALASLISWKGRYIDPHGNTYFVAGFLPNLMGHRDAVNTPQTYETECPGDELEALLPGLRGDVYWAMGEVAPVPLGQLVQVNFGRYVATGQILPIQFVVKNVGTGVMVTEGPTSSATIFDYNQSDTFASRNYSELTGSWRVGVDYDGNGTGRDHPYRWGLSDALNPGETSTINGEVTLTQPGTWHYWAGLVQEGVAWAQDRLGTTTVKVGPPLPPRIYIPYSVR